MSRPTLYYLLICLITLSSLFCSPTRATTITVNTTADDYATNGNCTLGEAITAANTNAVVDNCTAGESGSDTIDLTGIGGGIFLLNNLPIIIEDLTIKGPGSGSLLVNANGTLANIFRINSPGNDQTVNIIGLRITGGAVTGYGGGIYVFPGDTLNLSDCSIDNNTATLDGGGLENDQGKVKLTGCTVSQNTGARGGGIFNINGTLELENTTLEGNTATVQGGGIYHYSGTATIRNSVIDTNSAEGNGGGLYNTGLAAMTVTDSTVSNNRVNDGNAGGIYNNGNLTVFRTTFVGNTVPVWGAAVFNNGTMTIADSTVFNNTGSTAVTQQGAAVLTNTTISGNTGLGLGNTCANEVEVMFTNCTVAFNTGGGISNCNQTMTLQNTLVAHNTSYDCSSINPIIFEGNNLDSDDTCGLTGSGDLSETDPRLGPLQDNGGPALTHALLAGSPAINAGDNKFCPDADQRGISRPQGSVCDIGAFEYKSRATPLILLLLNE
jgi:CSLREA domain-containing protein